MNKSGGRTRRTPDQVVRLVKLGKRYQWPKGVSGNPSGRPATQTLVKACREVLNQEVPGTEGLTFAEANARGLADKTLEGDMRAAAELANRVEGRPTQSRDLQVTELARRFESTSRDELIHYAETGQLPQGVSNGLEEA
jgi:hypothetical protein